MHPTYNKLERGDYEDPPLHYPSNGTVVLGVARAADLFESRWRERYQPQPEVASTPWRS